MPGSLTLRVLELSESSSARMLFRIKLQEENDIIFDQELVLRSQALDTIDRQRRDAEALRRVDGYQEVNINHDKLLTVGINASRLLPDALLGILGVKAEGYRCLHIESEETIFAWELICVPVQGDWLFLAELFKLTLWVPYFEARKQLSLKRLALVGGAKSQDLEQVPREIELLRKVLEPRVEVTEISPEYTELRSAMRFGSYDGWHFLGHGTSAGNNADFSKFILNDVDYIRAEHLGAALALRGALVFLNICHGGVGGVGATGSGGWPSRLLEAGAAAVIAPRWAVDDEAARRFSISLYRNVLSGASLAHAVWAARLQIKLEFAGDATWLAYAVYCHPKASIGFSQGARGKGRNVRFLILLVLICFALLVSLVVLRYEFWPETSRSDPSSPEEIESPHQSSEGNSSTLPPFEPRTDPSLIEK